MDATGEMMKHDVIPDVVIRRLPVYVRTLRQMLAEGITGASSEELGARVGVSAAQIRRDLSYFGRFGTQGKGYDIQQLELAVTRILHLDRQWDAALVGFGHLGQAIAQYHGFEPNSFRIAAIFARNPDHVGRQVNGVVVLDRSKITEVVREMGVRIGIIAVPAAAAQDVADQLIAGGVRAILNYAPVILRLPDDVWMREIDPTGALQSLTYYLDTDRPSGRTPSARLSGKILDEAAGA
ncbi:MAG TPA: redox-sensing transcriptional repressor Rex [Nitrolancea sp.]|nr:redox-sensing transcriptional repressor Rex [Nitrolancea sp.]